VLTFNKRVLLASSGKISRQAIDYKYIPSDIEKHGYILKVDSDRLNVEIIKSNLKLDKITQTDYGTQNRSVGTSDDCTSLETELWELLPDVCQFLAEVDAIHSTRLVQHMRLLADRSFPLTNISYRVFLNLRELTEFTSWGGAGIFVRGGPKFLVAPPAEGAKFSVPPWRKRKIFGAPPFRECST